MDPSIEQQRVKQRKAFLGNLVSHAKYRAREIGVNFDLNTADLELLWQKQKGLCALSGLTMGYGFKRDYTKPDRIVRNVSLDRIDSSKGYDLGNVQLVCRAINRMKWNMDERLFKDLCGHVAKRSIEGDKSTLSLSAVFEHCSGKSQLKEFTLSI